MLWACFTLSGAAALALEMLWMRSAGLLFGQTPMVTATVLAWSFAGLGAGAAWAATTHGRPVRRYGRLEFGAAAGAVWSLACFGWLASDSAAAALRGLGAFQGLAGVGLAALPAALCLGATLPAVGEALAGASVRGWRAATLYAFNTLGGAAGTALAGFGLPVWIGVSSSYAAVAACSALCGGVALWAGRREVERPAPAPAAAGETSAGGRRRLVVVAAGSGALALALEVFWTRLFAQVLHNSVYSFSAIALVFLLAIAAGAACAAWWLRTTAPETVAAAALLGAGAAVVGGLWVFVRWTDGLSYFGMRTGLGEYLARITALAAATAGPAALASGMVLPALWAAWGDDDGVARPLGRLSAANTFGGIGGALAAGFPAVSFLGIRGSLTVAAVAYVVLGDVVGGARGPRRWFAYAALLAVVACSPLRAPLVHLRSDRETLRALREGAGGIVSVVDSDGDRQLRLDNYYVLGGSAAAADERRLGLIPLLLHPQPRRAAFVGLATGITASAAPALGVPATTVVELVPEVAAAARAQFGTWNGDLLERPDVRLVIGDGRRFLAATTERFDVIVADLFIPWHPGAGSLYSREMYATAARRLAPGGLFCQWLPLYQLTREEFGLIARTFLAVFPQVTLWRAGFYADRPVVGLIGQLGPRPMDLARAAARAAALPEWSRDALLAAPRGLAMLYAGDLAQHPGLVRGASINTDDRPLIEFLAPRMTRMAANGDKDWFVGEPLAAFYDRLAAAPRAAPATPAAGQVSAQRAGTLLYRYALAATRHDADAADRFEAQVRALVPDVIADVDAAANGGIQSLTQARATLADLRDQEEDMQRRVREMEQRLSELKGAGGNRP